MLLSIAKWDGFAIESGNFCVILLTDKSKDYNENYSERHQKHKKCRMQFFVFLLSAERRQEGGVKRPPE